MKVAHLSSVHARYDTRIFIKQCCSLYKFGYEVTLIVADGKGNEKIDGVTILDVGRPGNRFKRLVTTTFRTWYKALQTNSKIYHLHDPELLPVGLFLRIIGKIVIYDMHENLPKQLLSKYYLKMPYNKWISKFMLFFQNITFRFLPVVFAENSYARDFWPIKHGLVILNYPILDKLHKKLTSNNEKFILGYIGEISKERGINQIIDALGSMDNGKIELMLAGPLRPDVSDYANFKIAISKGWLKYHGHLAPEDAWQKMRTCNVGLAILLPSPNFTESYPTKLFEYMGLCLPVIASDFPLWKEIVEGNQCGICINPLKPIEIAKAIDYLISNPDEALEMGKRGRIAIEQKYNWESEEKKLINLYQEIVNSEVDNR